MFHILWDSLECSHILQTVADTLRDPPEVDCFATIKHDTYEDNILHEKYVCYNATGEIRVQVCKHATEMRKSAKLCKKHF